MTHLTSDELIDAMEGLLAPERQAHLDVCAECRQQFDDLSAVLGEAKQVSVPEPSPLFWSQFSTRVRASIEAEPEAAWPAWLRWQVLAPIGAVALVLLALTMTLPKPASEDIDAGELAVLETPVEVDADAFEALSTLVGEFGIETASAAGVIEPGVADRAVLELNAEERQELKRLLLVELAQAKS